MHDQHWIYLEGIREKDLVVFIDWLYYGNSNIRKESFSSFLELDKEFNINNISGFKLENNCDSSLNIQTIRKSHGPSRKGQTFYCECNRCGVLSFYQDHKNKHFSENKAQNKDINMSNKINQSEGMKNIVGKNMEQDKCLKKDSGKGQGLIWESAEREIEVEKQLKGGGRDGVL